MKEFSSVLVTGGAGFIGSHLVDWLINKGYEVIVLDNFRSGKMENISRHLKNDHFRLVIGDVRDKKTLRSALNGVDAILHLAALISVEESLKNPAETHEVNVIGTLNLLQEAVRGNVKKFVYASSTAVYGEANSLPLREDCPLKPISPYASSKAASECYCTAFHRSYGLGTVILRYFNVYGPRQEHNPYGGVIPRFINNALTGRPLVVFGNGEQTRDFIYIDDVVRATILALESSDSVGETFNICVGKRTTINNLVRLIKRVTGKKNLQKIYDKPRKGDIRDNYGDPSKAEETLGFKAKINLEEGLKRYLKSVQKS